MGTQIETMDGINNSYKDSVIPKLPETNTSDVEKIADYTPNMADKFDVNSISTDQNAVTQKLSNTVTSQFETLECLVGKNNHNQQEDPVIQKSPETNTENVEKIKDDISNIEYFNFITPQKPSGKSLLQSKILSEATRAENAPKASNSS